MFIRNLLITVAVLSGWTTVFGGSPDWLVVATGGMVASDSPFASQAGAEILEAGGNAIDAATAVSFALGVTRPYSTGVGGGGFMIARFADGRIVVLDYRESAPQSATTDMYTSPNAGVMPNPSVNGHLAVGVPGLIAGRCQALEQYGTLPLARTLEPAIRLASEGFQVDGHYVENCRDTLQRYEKNPRLKQTCEYVYHLHLDNGDLHPVGFRLKQPALARFLKELANRGAELFYKGTVAHALVEEMRKNGGLIGLRDLRDYRVIQRQPVIGHYRNYEIISMPPPSSGGVALIQTLNILEALDFRSMAQSDDPLAAHYLAEAMKHAFADRARWLGDADFAAVPVKSLTSETYARKLHGKLKADGVLDLEQYGSAQLPDDAGTSHFCIVDRSGSAVVSTETINTAFGSLAAIAEWGIILNNEMDDFSARPGKPNAYGLVQSKRNAVEPRKRPLSSMTPTIVLKDNEPCLMLGASGGPRIISSVLNVMINVLDDDMPLEQAMLAPRLHHQWRPNKIFFDKTPPVNISNKLMSLGHQISAERRGGVVQAISKTPDGWMGASDPRKGGRPAGISKKPVAGSW